VLSFKADGNFNATNGFEELVRETFCETMNLNCTRVLLVNYNVTGTSATIELQVINQGRIGRKFILKRKILIVFFTGGSNPLDIVLRFTADYLSSFESTIKSSNLAPQNLSLTGTQKKNNK
jgi:hypothetical protein